ncbi:hypothetical protein, partial [Streptococcus suis]|uniref:hypothetical protein n=1 Tax=Streptococcus suis TaxID=1307 RepID=UPI001EE6B18D
MEFYENFYFDGEEWDKDVWDRRNLPLPDEITDQLLYFYQKGCKLKLRLAIALATWYNKVAIELY